MEKTIAYKDPFKFKSFTIEQEGAVMKVGTDGVLLGAWVNVTAVKKAIDIGTGTGLIALMIAQRQMGSRVTGVEIDRGAYELAKINFTNSQWSNRMTAIHDSVQNFALESEEFDLVVCNPPFFSGGTFSQNAQRNSVRHTIKLPHGDLLRSVRSLLSTKGRFGVVLPLLEGLRFKEMSESAGLHCSRMTEVKGHVQKDVERLLLEFVKQPTMTKVDTIAINKSDTRHDYTEEYSELVRDFYTIL